MEKRERFKKVGKLSLPIMASFLSFQLLGVTDLLMVGTLGKEAIASVGVALTLFYFFAFSVEGLFDGVTIMISRAFGEKNMQEIRGVMKHSFVLAAVSGLIGIAAFFPLSKALSLLTKSEYILKNGEIYLFISFLGIVPQLVNGVIMRFFMAIQKNKPVAVISNITVMANIFFCYLFIFGRLGVPAMGVEGSAIATLLAKITGMVCSVGYFMTVRKKYFMETSKRRYSFSMVKKIVKIGMPVAQTNFLEVSAWTFFVGFISRLGTSSMAAHEIGMKIKDVAYLPGAALGVVATTISGNMAGEKNFEGVKSYTYTAVKMAVGIMGIFGVFFFAFPEFFIGLFSKDKEVSSMGTVVLRIMALYQISDAIFIVLKGALNGLNDTKFVRNMVLIGSWGIMVPLAYVLTNFIKAGVSGAWIGLTIYVTLIGTAYFYRFKKMEWAKVV